MPKCRAAHLHLSLGARPPFGASLKGATRRAPRSLSGGCATLGHAVTAPPQGAGAFARGAGGTLAGSGAAVASCVSCRRPAALLSVLLLCACYGEREAVTGSDSPADAAGSSAEGGAAGHVVPEAGGDGARAGAQQSGGSGGGENAPADAPITAGGKGGAPAAPGCSPPQHGGGPLACPPPDWYAETIHLDGAPCTTDGATCTKRTGECFCPSSTHPVFTNYSCECGRWVAIGLGSG